jgi:hypothetical protein
MIICVLRINPFMKFFLGVLYFFFTSYYFCQLYVIGDKCQYMSEKTLFVFGYFHSLCEPILLRVQPCSQAPPPLLQRPCQLEGVGDGG